MEGGGYREEVDSEEGTTIVADSKPAPGWSAAVNGGGAVAVPVVMRDKATQTEGEKWRKTYKQRRDRAWNQRKVKKRAGEMTAATNDADNDDDESQQPVTSYSEGDKHPSNRAIKKAIREKNKEVRQQQQQQTVNGAKREEEGVESGGRAGEAAAAAAALRGGGNKREGGKKENAKTRRNWAWKARDKERARGKKEALERGEGLK
ncbi:MAG: hypothetical protein M1836_005754 [Candelina mexicana]|nr:MAG: hypothetical protein M1836_005754 [Candelina mexicana]